MQPFRILAIVLVIAGIAGLAYGRFSYTKETHEGKLGPIEFQVKDKKTVDVPTWASAAAIVIGGCLLLVPIKR